MKLLLKINKNIFYFKGTKLINMEIFMKTKLIF